MAVKGLFKHVERAERTVGVSVVQVQTQAGKEASMRRGPAKNNFSLRLASCSTDSDQYAEITEQLLTTQWGTSPIISGVKGSITKSRGVWSGTPVVDQVSVVSGNIVKGKGATSDITGYGKTGDYIQFSNNKKTYRLIEDADSDSVGGFTMKLDSPLVVDSVNLATIVNGVDVEFRFILTSPPSETYTQIDENSDQVSWGRIEARETIA